MKRCPECGRNYNDDSMSFCLDDGSELLFGPASMDEPATAILHSTAAPGEAPTREQINTTDPTSIFPSDSVPRPVSSAEFLFSQVKQHKKGFLSGLALVVLVIVGAFGGYKYFGRSGASTGSPGGANMKVTRVTSTGKATHAAISPDGNYIVHVMADAGKESLWVRQTATGSNVQILAPADVNYWGITFSRDGNYIYYVARAVGGGTGFLYRLPVLGGTPVTLVKDVDSPVSLSPDGQQIAFVRWHARDSGLWLANDDGTSEHQLAMLAAPETFIGGPSWSPDGTVIACGAISQESAVPHSTVLAVSVANGDKRPMTSQSWGDVGRVAWLGGDSLILIASEQNSTASQLWQLSYPAGQARPITHDLNNYTDVTLTADASTLVTVQTDLQLNVWLAPDGDARRARQLTTGKGPDGFNVSWTPDGKILYDSIVSGNLDIWLTDPVAGNQKQITTDPNFDYGPIASSDGRYIVFGSNRLGAYHIWRMNSDGSNPTQLTNTDRGESRAAVTPDGRWVVYLSNDAEGITWRMPIDGGDSDQIGVHLTTPAISPDGQSMAFWEAIDNQGPSLRRMAVRPLAAGSAARFYDMPQTALYSRNLQWRPDGRAVFFIGRQGDVSNIWVFPLDGSQPKQVTDFQSESIYSFAFSPDGKQLALTRGTSTNDVVLIKDFK